MTNSNPSINPADNDILAGAFRLVFRKLLQDVDDMLPAIVTAVDRGPPTVVQVRPQVVMLGTDGQPAQRAQIASVPVYTMGGGGFVMNLPVQVGDVGLIKASDRDISLYLQNATESPPNTFRMHNFADGFFFPQILVQWALANEDEECLTLQSLDGTVKIVFDTDEIRIVAPSLIITSDITLTGDFEMTGDLTATGNTIFNGNLRVNGNIEATGTITPNVPP